MAAPEEDCDRRGIRQQTTDDRLQIIDSEHGTPTLPRPRSRTRTRTQMTDFRGQTQIQITDNRFGARTQIQIRIQIRSTEHGCGYELCHRH